MTSKDPKLYWINVSKKTPVHRREKSTESLMHLCATQCTKFLNQQSVLIHL